MLSFKCDRCGAEMSVDSHGELFCNYCGSKEVFTDKELVKYKEFRFQVLDYLRALNENSEESHDVSGRFWEYAERKFFRTRDGLDVTVDYIYSNDDDVCTMYITKQKILFVYKKEYKSYAQMSLNGINSLEYPAADIKGLASSFPEFTGMYELEGDEVLLSFERPNNYFPLEMLGSFEPEHAAWLVSRLENICCVLEYSDMIHGKIISGNIMVNPFTHQVILSGGWWAARKKTEEDLKSRNMLDLLSVRTVANASMGMKSADAPKEFMDFINGIPRDNAFDDFALWDRIINNGFGGRRFAKFNI